MAMHNNHNRHPTWPPTLQLLPDSFTKGDLSTKTSAYTRHDQTLSDIDEDPFSHFLSPVLQDDDPFDESGYTAGITPYVSETETKTNRFRARVEERWDNYMAHRLLRHPPTIQSLSLTLPATPPEEDQLPELYIEDSDATSPDMDASSPPCFPSMFSDDEADGWEADRARGRSTTIAPLRLPRARSNRTLSGKKHAWREPSEDLWTLMEEDEDDVMKDESRRGRKRSKTVRWSEEVQVVEFER